MKENKWAALLEEEQEEYRTNPLWDENGIIINGGSREYPWTCDICSRHKQFGSLVECEPHFETEAHQNAIWWTYGAKGHEAPVVPRWSSRRAVRRARPPIFGETPSRPALTGSPPPASVPRDRPSTASAGNWSYTVSLHNATLNDVRIDGAFLTVTIPCDMELPPGATFEMDGASIYGDILPARGSTARGPPPSLHLSQTGAGDLDERACVSSAMTMAQPEPASAASGSSAQASSRQPTNPCPLPGMRVVITNPHQPCTAHPKPPPPWPARGAHAGASRRSAASARADAQREQCRREDDGEQDSSGS